MSRYEKMFHNLKAHREAAFIPFTVLGYPNAKASYDLICLLVENGADALELGIPFSDPVADGPIIQAAASQCLQQGFGMTESLKLITKVRKDYPDLPIGLLVYANLVFAMGVEAFVKTMVANGVDSLLVADMPLAEADGLRHYGQKLGLDIVFVLPPNADKAKIMAIGQASKGYVYMLGRKGVTGTDSAAQLPPAETLGLLKDVQAPPPVLGFGVSKPQHVQAAVSHGLGGVIAGSAIVERATMILDGRTDQFIQYVQQMKRATRP